MRRDEMEERSRIRARKENDINACAWKTNEVLLVHVEKLYTFF